MANYVKFVKGTHAKYTAGASTYSSNGSIYFAAEEGATRGTIYANGVAYGVNSEELAALNTAIDEKYYNVSYDSATGVFTFTKRTKDSNNNEVTKTITIPTVSNEADAAHPGLMTAAQKTALEGVISDVENLTDVVASNKIKQTSNKSDNKTILITPGRVTEDGGTKDITETNIDVNLGNTLKQDTTTGAIDVNIDGTTIIKDASTGELSVASSALTQYVGSDTIDISAVDQNNQKTISSPLKLAAVTGDALAALGTNVKEAYQLVGTAGTNVNNGATIKIYKDSSLKEVYLGASTDTIDASTGVITKNTVTDPQSLNFAYQLADGTYSLVKIDVSKFLSESEFGNGLEVVSGVVVVKLSADNDAESFLSIGTDGGVKISGVQDAIDEAAADAKTTLTEVAADNPATGAKIVVTKTVDADGHYNYSITGQDLAADSDLDAEVTRAEDIEGKIAAATGVVITKTQGQATTVTYSPESGANYGGNTNNIKDRIAALDAQIKTNADAIGTLGGNAVKAIEVNGVSAQADANNKASVTIDGSEIQIDKAKTSTNHALINTGGNIYDNDTLKAAITALEAQLLWYQAD